MANLNVAMIGPPGYAKEIGKQGTSSDITFYNLKKGERTITLTEPTRYPERLAPLFYAASMKRFAIMVVDSVDHLFGEALIMLHCCAVGRGLIVLRNFLVPEQVGPLLKGTIAEGYEFFDDDPIEIRGRLFQEMDALPTVCHDQKGSVSVDNFFPVRGVGTVALGTMAEGSVRRHAKLRVMPGGKEATVRSIQKHDEESDVAVEGERVGMALKNVECEDLERGTVLTDNPDMRESIDLELGLDLVSFLKQPIRQGMVVHLGHWMQFIPARVTRLEGEMRHPLVSISLEKPLVHPSGSRVVLHHLEGGKLRVMGSALLP